MKPINHSLLSPAVYAIVVGLALCTGMGVGLYYLLTRIPANNQTESVLAVIIGPTVLLGLVHAWLLPMIMPGERSLSLRVAACQVPGAVLCGLGLFWLITTLRPQLLEGGALNLYKTGLLGGLVGVMLGGLAGWIGWGQSRPGMITATVLGWGFGAALCAGMIAVLDALLYASGY